MSDLILPEDDGLVIPDNLDSADWDRLYKWLLPRPPLFCPHEPFAKQLAFLRTNRKEVLYGGAAGGGKSDAILMAASQYVDVPGYNALIVRNTFADLDQPDAIMDRARQWWAGQPGVHYSAQKRVFTFPSGARIVFGYMEHAGDELQYQGAQFQFFGVDEVTQIREESYKYVAYSRLRRPSDPNDPLSQVPLRIRVAGNPAPNWVRQHFLVEGESKGRLFIKSTMDENPFLDIETYKEGFEHMNPTLRAQLEHGDWWAVESGTFFKKDDFKFMDISDFPKEYRTYGNIVRYWDLSGTEPGPSNTDPDWTVGALVSLVGGVMFIHDIKRARLNPDGVEKLVLQTAMEDGNNIPIRMDQDPGQAGKAQISHYSRNVLLGYNFAGCPTIKNKAERVGLWAPKAKRGEVYLRSDVPWTGNFLDEALSFTGEDNTMHDDQMDAVSGGFEFLTGLTTKQRGTVKLIV